MKVEIFTRDSCQYCEAALRLLQRRQVSFDEIALTDELAARLKDQTGQDTTPIIFIDGTHVGGCQELYALEGAGKLDAMLAA